jgi:pyruvate formate lyase activating enzyme
MIIGGLQKLSLADYPGKTCAVIFTVSCNMRCSYCHNSELVLPERCRISLSLDEVDEFLIKRQNKLDAITITGGEPTMHQDLPQYIKKIKAMGYLVKLDSNGTNPDMLEGLIGARLVDFIAMDIKGPLDKYQQITERPVFVEAIERSIKLIMESGIDYEFRTTVVRDQLFFGDFNKIGELIRGAKRYALQKFVPTKTNNPDFMDRVSYNDDEMLQIKNIMSAYVNVCVIH